MGGTFDVQCPIVTPIGDDGSVDTDGLVAVADALVDAGIDGLVPCGTTGEFAALTDDERRTVVRTTVRAADGRVPVMAGVGGTAVDDVRRRIRDAADAGADSVLVPAPYFGGQASREGNEAFFRAVLEEPPLPVYLYNIPSAVGQTLRPDTVVSLADRDAVVGIKDSSGDIAAFDEVVRRTPDEFEVYQGWDAGFVPALVMGADGGINSLTHLVADAFDAAVEAVTTGDIERARELQQETIDPPFAFCREHGFGPSIKAALAERGVIESDGVRPPQESLSESERAELIETVE